MKLLLYDNRLMVVWFLVRSFILFENQWRRIRNGLAMLLCRCIQNNCFLVVWINGGSYGDQRNIGVTGRERRNGKKARNIRGMVPPVGLCGALVDDGRNSSAQTFVVNRDESIHCTL